ncbi:MAG TPA: bifunctional UDP-sugar hydrolase/5'-nucleotidase [Longimicrobiaceae bacterium]|nr:bifunctional UDP-sugar hydrolase/5'-nucleotidase [Longimicrobiaceae bacterium]
MMRTALLAGALAWAGAAQAQATEKRLRVVHTNDVHGHLLPQTLPWSGGRMVGGAAVLAAYFDSAAAHFDGATVVLSGGDDMQGTAISNLSGGRAVIQAMNAAGYDAAAVGNHEFDWGLDTLRRRIGESRFPWLAANLYVAGTRRNPAWVRPWVMIRRRGIKVAVVGAALASTPQMVMAGRVRGLTFGPEAPAIDRGVRQARAAGADFVIVLMHAGAVCDTAGAWGEAPSAGCRGDEIDIARKLREPVDLVLGGHSHRRVLTEVGGVPVLEAGSYAAGYSRTELVRRDGRTVVRHRQVSVPWADSVRPDSAVQAVVRAWEGRVARVAARPVTAFAAAMDTVGGDFALGRLIADAFHQRTGAQAAFVNNSSIRREMPAGTITYGDLYELQPFQNTLVVLTVTGAQLRAALEHALGSAGGVGASVSGMQVTYDPVAPAGTRVRGVRLDGGRELRDADHVSLAMTDFVATGGDGYTMLVPAPRRAAGLVDLDALISYLQTLPHPVAPPPDRRWIATP